MSRRLRKLSYDGHKVLVRWEIPRHGDVDERELVSADKPAPSLIGALAALAVHVGEICELPAAYVKGLRIRGCTCSYGGDEETLGVSICALKDLGSTRTPLVLNTPHLPTEPYSAKDADAPLLSDTASRAIALVETEAFRYVDGHREQIDAFTPAVDDDDRTRAAGAAALKDRLRKSRPGKRGGTK